MFHKYSDKSDKYRNLAIKMINDNSWLNFKNLSKFSRYIYLYWLNENKKHHALVSKQFNSLNPFYTAEQCCITNQVFRVFNAHKEKLYKPLQKLI